MNKTQYGIFKLLLPIVIIATPFFSNIVHAAILSLTDRNSLYIKGWVMENLEVIDSTRVIVVYDYKHKYNPDSDEIGSGLVNLFIGDKINRYFFQYREAFDREVTLNLIKRGGAGIYSSVDNLYSGEIPGLSSKDPHEAKIAAGDSSFNGELWIDKETNRLIERFHGCRSMFNESIAYEEDLPTLQWQLTQEQMNINGYECNEARCKFRGREWIAWFTIEIPVNTGPWKLNGLPGLIIRAYDSEDDYSWEAVTVKQERVAILYNTVENERLISRKQVMKYYKNLFENPYSILKGSHASFTVYEKVNGKSVIVDPLSWTIPYNPIEFN